LILEKEIEINNKKHLTKRFFGFYSSSNLPLELRNLITKFIEFSDKSILKSEEQTKLFTDICLNTFTRCVIQKNHIEGYKDKEDKDGNPILNKSLEDIHKNNKVVVPLTNSEFLDKDKKVLNPMFKFGNTSYYVKRKVLDALTTLGIFYTEKGLFLGVKHKDNKCTSVKLNKLHHLNREFTKYLEDSSTKIEYEEFINLIGMMYNPQSLSDLLCKFDWNNLSVIDKDGFYKAQANVEDKLRRKYESPKSDISFRNKATKDKDKVNPDMHSISYKDLPIIENINNAFKSDFLKYHLSYTRKYQVYLDSKDSYEVGSNELILNQGGRLYSTFTGIEKGTRKWITKNLGLKEVDLSSAMFQIIYGYVNDELYDGRFYNAIAESILKEKNVLDNLVDLQKNFMIKQLADLIKEETLLIYNMNSEKSYINSIDKTLVDSCLNVNFIKELKKDYPNSTVKEAMKLEGLLNNDETRDEIEIHRYKRNNNFRNNYKNDNMKLMFLDYLGNKTISAKSIIRAVRREFPELSQFEFTSNWQFSQNIESEMIVKVSNSMKEDKLTPYSCYDAVYVPSNMISKYSQLMDKFLLESIREFKESKATELLKSKDALKEVTDNLLLINNRSITKNTTIKV
jgi:hypothetical protein